ncbi:MAG: PAS domain S-box protein [Deltaproteobacteria bacterium]|nr:PAS domain S-box protein [Deltaproteobacteria bacterium]
MKGKPTYEELEERIQILEKRVKSYEDVKDILCESETSCCRLQESAFEGISVCEEGVIREANRAMTDITGYQTQELIGMNILSIFAPEWRDFVLYNIETASEQCYEAVCLRKDGSTLPVEIRGKNIAFMGRMQRVVSLRDVAERKQAEELYKTIAEETQAGVYVVENRKFIYLNQNAARYAGYLPHELVGKDSLFCVHRKDRKKISENLKRALENKRSLPYTYRIVTKKGDIKWMMETVTPITYSGKRLVLGNVMDVTEIREARQRMEELEELEASILDAIPHAVIGLADRRIIFANHAVQSVFGWKPEELIGEKSSRLYRTDAEYEEVGEKFYNIRDGVRTHTEEFPCRHKNGHDIICMMSASIIGDSIKDKRVVVVYEDITERKKAREKLLEYHENLRSLASELSLTEERERQFIATALHDGISQTMAVAKIKLESLEKQAASSYLAEPLKDIIKLMDQLIYDTRTLTLDLSPPVLYVLGLEAALEWLAELFQEKYTIHVQLELGEIESEIDKDISFFLFRSTQELLMNVVKHAQTGNALITMEKRGDTIILSVEDDGKGFDESDLDFSRDWSRGFGLFSIRERLDYLGGQCCIESKKGEGTRVTMVVPPLFRASKEKGYKADEHNDSPGR